MRRTALHGVAGVALGIASIAQAVAGPFDKVSGDWIGQAEFRASVGGVPDEASHGVVGLLLRIEPGGKILSAKASNGCRLLGVVTPWVSSFRVQVTMSECLVASLNGRYEGTVSNREDSLPFQLQLHDLARRRSAAVTATLTPR